VSFKGVVPNAAFFAGREHFPFFLSVYKIVVILHTDELRPAILLGNMLHSQKLVRIHGRSTNIPYFAHHHQIYHYKKHSKPRIP
jgi:hypothetical protein